MLKRNERYEPCRLSQFPFPFPSMEWCIHSWIHTSSWFWGCGCSVNGPTAVGNRPAFQVEFFDRWWEKNSINPPITFGLFDALNLFWLSNKDFTLFLASGSAYCLTYCLLLWNLKVFRAQCFSSNCQVGSWIYRAPLQLILDLKWNNKRYHLVIFIS